MTILVIGGVTCSEAMVKNTSVGGVVVVWSLSVGDFYFWGVFAAWEVDE